jgi:hypothetical protein
LSLLLFVARLAGYRWQQPGRVRWWGNIAASP